MRCKYAGSCAAVAESAATVGVGCATAPATGVATLADVEGGGSGADSIVGLGDEQLIAAPPTAATILTSNHAFIDR
ncbi:MAG TPA: hypothetical protein PLF40_12115 [Kofleriaceae bacterium]|nr:hypothetical protein [Kofleriaceae bacterium]